MSVRQFASAPNKGEIYPGYFKLKEIQKLYQVSALKQMFEFQKAPIQWSLPFRLQKNDGLPIHLKRGASDKALYYFIFGLCGVGLVGVADFFYSLP